VSHPEYKSTLIHVFTIYRQLHNKHVATKEATLNELQYMVEIEHSIRYRRRTDNAMAKVKHYTAIEPYEAHKKSGINSDAPEE